MTRPGDDLLYLGAAAVDAALGRIDPLAAVAEALACHAAGDAHVASEATLRWAPEGGGMARTLNMPGMLCGPGRRRIGTKIINASTENPARGLPRADGLMLLFDPVTARPVAILQVAAISALRTAAVSTLAAQRLRSSRDAVLGVVGAGPLGRRHVTLMLEHLDVARVLVCDRVAARARALVDELAGSHADAEFVAVDDPADVAGEGTIVVTATTTTTPYLAYDALRPGAVVVNVSLDDLHEDAYLRADRLYVDDWKLVVEDSQRLLGKLARSGRVSGPGETRNGARAVDGTLGELLAGACPARDGDDEIIVVNPFGMAIEDLALAGRVVEIARRDDLGVTLRR